MKRKLKYIFLIYLFLSSIHITFAEDNIITQNRQHEIFETQEYQELMSKIRKKNSEDKIKKQNKEEVTVNNYQIQNIYQEYLDNGLTLFNQKQYQKSLNNFKEANKIFPSSALKYNIAICYINIKEYDEALKYLLEIKNFPDKDFSTNINNLIQTYEHLGMIYKYKKEYNTAIEYYTLILTKYPQNINSLKNIIEIYDLTNNCPQLFDTLNYYQTDITKINYELKNCISPQNNTINIKTYNNTSTNTYDYLGNNNFIKQYEWDIPITIYIICFILILFLGSSEEKKIIFTDKPEYTVSVDINGKPVKPDLSEFNINQKDYDFLINLKNDNYENLKFTDLIFPFLFMVITCFVFEAPTFYFPTIKDNPIGFIIGYILCIIAIYCFRKRFFSRKLSREESYKLYLYDNAIEKFNYKNEEYRKQIRQKQLKEERKKANQLRLKKEYWLQFDGFKFEQAIKELFQDLGYNAILTKKTGDGGVDLILHKDNIKIIVQCKAHKKHISPEPVRALWGIKNDYNADKVILIALGGFSKSCFEFKKNKPNYIFWDINDVIKYANKANYNYSKTFN